MIKRRKLMEAHAILHALDNDIRRRMVKVLSNRPYGLSELKQCIGVPICLHLTDLIITEIVIEEKAPDGQYRYYTNLDKMNIITKAIKKFSEK